MLYPFSYNRGDGYGPDRLCDVIDCMLCVGHSCDCEVCTNQLEAPALKVLNDSHEHGNRKRSPNWEEEDRMEDLKTMLAQVKAGDYVTAFGKATTGAEVTRTGVLLAEPQDMKATHNGEKVAAIRVRVGEAGTDPAKRSTWTTLIPGHGSIRPVEPPKDQDQEPEAIEPAGTSEPGEIEWESVPAREWHHRGAFLYGGKGSKGTAPQRPVKVRVVRQGFSSAELEAVDSGEVVATPRNAAKIWAAKVPEGWQPDEDEDERQDVNELHYGKPVHHVETGELVGFWTLARFTPVEEVPGYTAK
ncbi:hypothetical protein [Streptomyces sp. DG1A-41]|uniref:hypothetical protein n=1 Tax=Streptomyces sp. DG1A-41 TaxID=3125779 RepID=UPI0030D00B88